LCYVVFWTGRIQQRHRERLSDIWFFAALAAVYLSADSVCNIKAVLRNLLVNLSGNALYADGAIWWVAIYVIIFGMIGSRMLVEMRHYLASCNALFAAATCQILAVCAELRLLEFHSSRYNSDFNVMFIAGMEMLSALFMFLSVGLFARHMIFGNFSEPASNSNGNNYAYGVISGKTDVSVTDAKTTSGNAQKELIGKTSKTGKSGKTSEKTPEPNTEEHKEKGAEKTGRKRAERTEKAEKKEKSLTGDANSSEKATNEPEEATSKSRGDKKSEKRNSKSSVRIKHPSRKPEKKIVWDDDVEDWEAKGNFDDDDIYVDEKNNESDDELLEQLDEEDETDYDENVDEDAEEYEEEDYEEYTDEEDSDEDDSEWDEEDDDYEDSEVEFEEYDDEEDK
ncbi:MAG: hypothetical protein ACRC2T_18100, partial [Thermoguttaceae bacterium]